MIPVNTPVEFTLEKDKMKFKANGKSYEYLNVSEAAVAGGATKPCFVAPAGLCLGGSMLGWLHAQAPQVLVSWSCKKSDILPATLAFRPPNHGRLAVNSKPDPGSTLVLSYLELRTAVGIIGLALPFLLALGKLLLQGPGMQSSISAYYYTDMRNVFVGSLWAIGVFLLSTKGYNRGDTIAGYLACIFAVGVALFPMAPEGANSRQKLIGTVHWSLAALLFLTLAYFSLFLFTKTGGNPTPRKLRRNIVYRACGWTILASMLLIFIVTHASVGNAVDSLAPIFWLESLAVVAFGVSWLTKGEAILKDEEG